MLSGVLFFCGKDAYFPLCTVAALDLSGAYTLTTAEQMQMASLTTPDFSIEQYLRTPYSPDCDFIDGTVEDRNSGELDHANLQTAIAAWFRHHQQAWNIYSFVELRVRISPTRVRIPDVTLLSRSAPREQVITHPPLAVIEVLSPEDRFSRYQERLTDYRQMGVKNIWVVDPASRKGFDCGTPSWIEQQDFRIEGTPITLSLPALFAELDSAE